MSLDPQIFENTNLLSAILFIIGGCPEGELSWVMFLKLGGEESW